MYQKGKYGYLTHTNILPSHIHKSKQLKDYSCFFLLYETLDQRKIYLNKNLSKHKRKSEQT